MASQQHLYITPGVCTALGGVILSIPHLLIDILWVEKYSTRIKEENTQTNKQTKSLSKAKLSHPGLKQTS